MYWNRLGNATLTPNFKGLTDTYDVLKLDDKNVVTLMPLSLTDTYDVLK